MREKYISLFYFTIILIRVYLIVTYLNPNEPSKRILRKQRGRLHEVS